MLLVKNVSKDIVNVKITEEIVQSTDPLKTSCALYILKKPTELSVNINEKCQLILNIK